MKERQHSHTRALQATLKGMGRYYEVLFCGSTVPLHTFSSHHDNSPRLLINAGNLLWWPLFSSLCCSDDTFNWTGSPSCRGYRSDNEEYLYTSEWRLTRLTKEGPTEMVRLDYMWSIWAIYTVLTELLDFTLTANVSKDLFHSWTQEKGSDLRSEVKVGHSPD